MAKKQVEKKQHLPTPPPSSKAKKQKKEPPPSSSLGPSLSTKPLAKSASAVTKQQKQVPPLPPDSPYASSSNGDESPSPSNYRLEKSAGVVLPEHQEPSDSTDGGAEEEDEGSETDNGSNEEESSDGFAPVAAKPNQLPLLQACGEGKVEQSSSPNTSSVSDSEDGESDGEEVESSSRSDQPHSLPTHKHAENLAMKTEVLTADSDSESSSYSEQPNSSPHKSSASAAALLSSKQVDRPAQVVDKSSIIATTPSSTSVFKNERKNPNDITEEAGQEKKNPFKRIWSNEDVRALLRAIVEYKERHHVVPSSLIQVEPLHASIKELMSNPVTSNQMHVKIRHLKHSYTQKAKRMNDSIAPSTLNANDAAVFDLSKMIWGSSKDESSVPKKNIKGKKMKPEIKNVKGKGQQLPMMYPSFHRFKKYEHANIPLALRFNDIPNAKSKELDVKCEKLEITEVRLHVKKQELVRTALELIDKALSKCG